MKANIRIHFSNDIKMNINGIEVDSLENGLDFLTKPMGEGTVQYLFGDEYAVLVNLANVDAIELKKQKRDKQGIQENKFSWYAGILHLFGFELSE